MENRAEGIACNELCPSGLGVRRQPCREALQLRHDDAVMSRDQRENSPGGQSVVDEGGQISCAQKLPILPVNRNRKAVGCASGRRREELGAGYVLEQIPIAAGKLFQSRVIVVTGRGRIPGIAGVAGQEHHGAEPSRNVQQNGYVIELGSCQPMSRVMLANEVAASEVEGLHPCFRPDAAGHRVRQHLQALRICEHPADSPVAGLVHERIRVRNVRTLAQDLADIGFGEMVEAQHRDLAVSGYALEIGAIDRSEPVRLSTGQAKCRSPEGIEPGSNPVERRQPVRRSGPHLIQTVDEQSRAARFGKAAGRGEVTRLDLDSSRTATGFLLETPLSCRLRDRRAARRRLSRGSLRGGAKDSRSRLDERRRGSQQDHVEAPAVTSVRIPQSLDGFGPARDLPNLVEDQNAPPGRIARPHRAPIPIATPAIARPSRRRAGRWAHPTQPPRLRPDSQRKGSSPSPVRRPPDIGAADRFGRVPAA